MDEVVVALMENTTVFNDNQFESYSVEASKAKKKLVYGDLNIEMNVAINNMQESGGSQGKNVGYEHNVGLHADLDESSVVHSTFISNGPNNFLVQYFGFGEGSIQLGSNVSQDFNNPTDNMQSELDVLKNGGSDYEQGTLPKTNSVEHGTTTRG
ncbi:MAG: hypothetical protein Q8835_02505 [Sweet potato little leaf phytoplasma]|nr:hypothetical protein [Sweet potato little leaf phytoplasma]